MLSVYHSVDNMLYSNELMMAACIPAPQLPATDRDHGPRPG